MGTHPGRGGAALGRESRACDGGGVLPEDVVRVHGQSCEALERKAPQDQTRIEGLDQTAKAMWVRTFVVRGCLCEGQARIKAFQI